MTPAPETHASNWAGAWHWAWIVRRGAACLALGLVMTVGVAWIGAAVETQPGSPNAAGFIPVRRSADEPGRPIERFVATSPDSRHVGTDSGLAADGWVVKRDQFLLLYIFEPGASSGVSRTVEVYAAGWPLRALEWTDMPFVWLVNAAPPASSAWERAWELGIEYRGRGGLPGGLGWDEAWRRLPVRPAGSGIGLAVNTALWGCVAGVMLWGIGGVRRRRRRTRGLCVACGYPVRDACGRVTERCPECGAGVDSATAREGSA